MTSRYLALVLVVLGAARPARAQSVMDLDGRQYVVDCAGTATGPMVVLLPGGSGTVEAWSKVQDGVARFARVCSYEPAGPQRGQGSHPQTMDEMAADLGRLLDKTAGAAPVVLVGHTAGGILARRFAARYPDRVAAFVFLDSSHEEQMWRLAAIAPTLLRFGFGPKWNDPAMLAAMGLLPKGQRSTWHTDRPMIVIEHGVSDPVPPPARVTPAQVKQLDAAWDAMQQDLVSRSSRGLFLKADGSGSAIHLQMPNLVVSAIGDILKEVR